MLTTGDGAFVRLSHLQTTTDMHPDNGKIKVLNEFTPQFGVNGQRNSTNQPEASFSEGNQDMIVIVSVLSGVGLELLALVALFVLQRRRRNRRSNDRLRKRYSCMEGQ